MVSCTGLYVDLASDALRKDGDEQLKEQLKDLAEGKIPVLHGMLSQTLIISAINNGLLGQSTVKKNIKNWELFQPNTKTSRKALSSV